MDFSLLKIPIAENAEDLIAWHYDNRGVFSVKSAYKVLDLVNTQQGKQDLPEGSRVVGSILMELVDRKKQGKQRREFVIFE
jgi:hypothetical protein